MKTPNRMKNDLSFLALLLLIFVVLACNINTGESSDSDSGNDEDTEEISIKKKKTKVNKTKKKKKKEEVEEPSSENEDEGDFIAVYSDIANENYTEFDQEMRNQKVLESIAEGLNETLALPEDIEITFDDCGQVNAWYSSKDQRITMCYELMDDTYKGFIKMGMDEQTALKRMLGATEFVFYHELGHGLVDIYDLTITGREEDAVDQLSTYILLDEMDEEQIDTAISGVAMFRYWGLREGNGGNYAGEHSLGKQRFYNVACWMFGRDNEAFSEFVTEGILPKRRAVRCENEYNQLSKSWGRLLDPWIKS